MTQGSAQPLLEKPFTWRSTINNKMQHFFIVPYSQSALLRCNHTFLELLKYINLDKIVTI